MSHRSLLGPRLALGGLLAGAVLCAPSASAQGDATFTKDVLPILQTRCQGCHRVGQMAPMSLVTFEEVRPWARAIRTKVIDRSMPPWHIDKTIGIQEFQNDISLTETEIETIVGWVDAGAPRGNPADLPPPVDWSDGDIWQLEARYGRPPDHVVSSLPWTQPADGQDQWYQPVVDTGMTEDRWVTGIEIRPSMEGRRVTHHSNVHLQQVETAGDHVAAIDVTPRGSYFSEFAVGKIGDVFRENTGKLLKADSRFTFSSHYHSVGEEITARTDVGLWFYPRGDVPKYRVYGQVMGSRQAQETLDIPPGKISLHHSYVPLTAPARLENFQPHMHVRGKAMSMEAIYLDGRVEMLSHVENFDFNWHVNYVYTDDAAPILPRGTIIHISAWHDNTAANRANPDSRQWVGWGQRSYDEMYHAHVNVTYLSDEDYEQIIAGRQQGSLD